MLSPDRIVVGYDGSAEAGLAVRWGARHAVLLGCELQVVHCSLWPLLTHDLGPVKGVAGSGLQHQAQAILDAGKAEALSIAPRVRVRSSLLYGLPAAHLRRIAKDARMLVLGSRGIGGFMGLLVGSVSLELAATASCPVAVIRFDQNPEGPVVVGISTSGSLAALHDACALARGLGVKLIILHVLRTHLRSPKDAQPSGAGRQAARHLMESAADTARGLIPGGDISEVLAEDASVPRALLNAARGAALIVVGSRAQGIVQGTMGSTAHAVLHHAKGPVLISRQPEPGANAGNVQT
ncbi:MAG TPA: universal stress protein [Arthrobacter sp.]|nr:universal stress protein [Arthrobacter sp.]